MHAVLTMDTLDGDFQEDVDKACGDHVSGTSGVHNSRWRQRRERHSFFSPVLRPAVVGNGQSFRALCNYEDWRHLEVFGQLSIGESFGSDLYDVTQFNCLLLEFSLAERGGFEHHESAGVPHNPCR